MNRIKESNITALLLMTLAVLLAGCQSQRPIKTSAAYDQSCKLETPQIVFNSKEHDFGRVDMGSQNTCSFEFRNNGGNDLVIENIFASCGCTVTKAEKTVIAPGQASEIEVTYRADSFGKSRKRIHVSTNDPANPQIDLWVTAEVPGSPKSTQTLPSASSAPTQLEDRPSPGAMSPELKQALRNLNKATGG